MLSLLKINKECKKRHLIAVKIELKEKHEIKEIFFCLLKFNLIKANREFLMYLYMTKISYP